MGMWLMATAAIKLHLAPAAAAAAAADDPGL